MLDAYKFLIKFILILSMILKKTCIFHMLKGHMLFL
jgi:hypothetical protein